MKFGKRLQSQIDETLPEWRDKYLSYKQLKKRLKLISAPDCFTEAAFSSPEREAGTVVPPIQASPEEVLARRGAASDVSVAVADVPVLSEGQDSSVHGGTKSSSSSGDGVVSECVHPELGASELSAEEADFIHLLNAELEKFNTFFIEKEEEYVIRLQELKERCEQFKEKNSTCVLRGARWGSLNEDRINIKKDIVNFHGEMVLLLNYSSLNYTGLVKILKKHDKRTGALLRMPFIRNVLQQPFFTTELLSKLVRECETNLQSLFPPLVEGAEEPGIDGPSANALAELSQAEHSGGTVAGPQQSEVGADQGNASGKNKGVGPLVATQAQVPPQGEDVDNIYRSTLAALRTIKELRRGSSTYSMFSLPPFNKGEDDDEDVNATPTPLSSEKHV